jgi:hypothetical protein
MFFLTDLKSKGCEIVEGRSFREFILRREPALARQWDGELVKIQPNRDMLDRIHQYGWLAAKLHYMFDTSTDIEDIRVALTQGTIGEYFEEHAVNCYIENRSCGVAPQREEGVTAALTLGVVEQLDDAQSLLHEFEWSEWRRMWVTASEHGLSLNESKTLDIMREVVDLAKIGLRARGAGEEKFLEPALTRLEQRKTPADDMIKAFNVGGMQQLIKEFKRVI